jgi:hypothetical protein
MNWNPRLEPYKNAITNQLFISASISMYLYFPGDNNDSPYGISGVPAHSRAFLRNAVIAYDWLKRSGMKNDQGLYIDGFHIRDHRCTERNEMIYTYNQGVVLTGLRGLWQGTGVEDYLRDGHRLIQNTIRATGFQLHDSFFDTRVWTGLGRNGILEEYCDHIGDCSQDNQAFKGIYFHHLSEFCEPLPTEPTYPRVGYWATPELALKHSQSCKLYTDWVTHNAMAAMSTRDAAGRFGMWWGAEVHSVPKGEKTKPLPQNAEDYRRSGLGNSTLWGSGWSPEHRTPITQNEILAELASQLPDTESITEAENLEKRDANDRGRGRTVESQSGGVAVVRAMWEFIYQHSETESGDTKALLKWIRS